MIEKPMVLLDFATESLVRVQVSAYVSLASAKDSVDSADY